MNHIADIFTLPEQQLTPPEYPEWTDKDKRIAEENLEYRILYQDEKWDENLDGWKGDMFVEWERLMLQFVQGKIDRADCFACMHDALHSHVARHARDEVAGDPDKYCEANDD
jgi:hypothetical protein